MFDSSKTSAIRSLLARSDEPVSVTSTIASTRSGAFTSVAPHENSTSAVTPCSASQRFVRFTTSVAIRLPSRSLTERMSESSGTASTQRTGRIDAFEYTRSATTWTSAPVSATQSSPVIPASNTPSWTYFAISCARTSMALNSSSSIDGKYERSRTENEYPALSSRSKVDSWRLPFGRPSLSTRGSSVSATREAGAVCVDMRREGASGSEGGIPISAGVCPTGLRIHADSTERRWRCAPPGGRVVKGAAR